MVDGKLVDSEYGRDFREIQRWKGGASNALLVEASTIVEAMRGSRSVLVGYRSAERAVKVHPPVKEPGEYWLVVFLGIRTVVRRSGSSREWPSTRTGCSWVTANRK